MLLRRLATAALLLCLVPGAAGAFGAREPAATLDLPNLTAHPPFDVQLGSSDDRRGPALRFSSAAMNTGAHALDLLATPRNPSAEQADAHQCVRWAAPRVCLERRQVGSILWHVAHQHFHFEDFALYELRALARDGTPVFGDEGLVAGGRKMSFCLADIEPNRAPDHPAYSEPFFPYYVCNVLASQGISPGWTDIYRPTREGQEVVVDGVAEGRYALVVTLDPDDRLHESDEDDNVAWAVVELRSGDVAVVGSSR